MQSFRPHSNFSSQQLKMDTSKCEDNPRAQIGRISSVKIVILPKQLQSKVNLYQNVSGSFNRKRNKILKFVWNHKISQLVKTIFRMLNKVGSITHPNCKLYCKAIVIKTICYWHVNRHNRSIVQKRQLRNSCIYGQLIYSKVRRDI